MLSENKTKTCCERAHPLDALYCNECGDALEDSNYRVWIIATFALAAGIEWGLARQGVLLAFRWPEVFMLEVFLLQLAYPSSKLVQKLRAPTRPVLREMASVFADRWSRMLLIGAWAFIGLSWARIIPRGMGIAESNLANPAHLVFRDVLVRASLAGLALVSVAVLISQGLRFFDLRISNTLWESHATDD